MIFFFSFGSWATHGHAQGFGIQSGLGSNLVPLTARQGLPRTVPRWDGCLGKTSARCSRLPGLLPPLSKRVLPSGPARSDTPPALPYWLFRAAPRPLPRLSANHVSPSFLAQVGAGGTYQKVSAGGGREGRKGVAAGFSLTFPLGAGDSVQT